MTHRTHLLGGASLAALGVLLLSTAHAQQSLPTIDVGGARGPARPGPVGRPAPGPARVTTTTPAPAPGPDRYAEPKPAPFSRTLPANIPAVVESRTRQEILKTTNVTTSADAFRYMPSILVRERYIGDRNAIVSTRTSGTIESAKALVYADNILLSNLLGNSFNFAPRWAMVSPAEISRIDVMHGPFSALYPGNSMGAVLTMTTRMPDNFEVHASGTGAVQPFSLYSRKELNLGGVMNVLVGDRINDLRYWVGYEYLDNQAQSQTFPGNIIRATTPRTRGTLFTGGHFDFNQEGFPRVITASAGADHVQSHMAKFKVSYDIAPLVRAKYQVGFWNLNNDTTVQSFINDRNGLPIYNTQNGRVQLGNFSITPGGVNPGHGGASHLMQALSLKSETGGVFDFDLSATSYNFLRDFSNGAASYGLRPNVGATFYNLDPRGLNQNLGGTYWRTGDARFILRPDEDILGRHELSLGVHVDRYALNSMQTTTAIWPSNYAVAPQVIGAGKTETTGAYVQDVWKFLPDWKLTLGGRAEWWQAFDGLNNSGGVRVASNFARGLVTYAPVAANLDTYPQAHKNAFSPKAALEWRVTPQFTMRGSMGRAYRFATVNELFFSSFNPSAVNINNPNLRPEICTCYDLTGEYRWVDAFGGAVGLFVPRVSLFLDERWDAIVQQRALSAAGQQVTTWANIDRARFRGVEAAAEMRDILTPGLDFSGGVTFTDSKILSNFSSGDFTGAPAFGNFAAGVPGVLFAGRQYPRVPRIRIRAVASYSPTPDLSLAVAARYSSAAFTSLANTDWNHNNYGNVDSEIIVFDAKARYGVAPNWWLSAGVNNIGRWKAYVNPNPYPQRTFFLALNYDLGGPDDGQAPIDRGNSGGASTFR